MHIDFTETKKSLHLVWPLLISMFLIMVGNGLQGTLLGLRADVEGFSSLMIGVIMGLYYFGYMIGWFFVPSMITAVGHIRVFAAFASMASTIILLHGVFVNPWVWALVRVISGISFVGLFIVAESWLNNIATNKLRGQIMGTYFFAINGGLFTGQFFLNFGSVETIGLFILVSILISLSLMPITLANKPSPGYEEPDNLPIKILIKKSPLSVASVVLSGFVGAGVVGMGAIYAKNIGLSDANVALFIALYVLGCGSIPLIAGGLSDILDRRLMIILMSIMGIMSSITALVWTPALYIGVFMMGGAISSIHSIAIAMMNDRINTNQMTSATATMILINGVSASISPLLIGAMLDMVGEISFLPTMAIGFMALLSYGIYRSIKGPEIIVEEQTSFQPIPARSAPGIAHIHEPETHLAFERAAGEEVSLDENLYDEGVLINFSTRDKSSGESMPE